MEKSKLGKLLDDIAIGFLFFVLTFLILKLYIKNNYICFIVSLLLLFIFIVILTHFQNKKYAKLGLKKQEQKQIEQLNFYIRSQNFQKQNQFIKALFCNHKSITKNNFILLENGTAILNKVNKNYIDDEDIFYVLSRLNYLKKNNIEEVSIVCTKANIPPPENCGIKIFFITPDILFSVAKSKNLIPTSLEKTQKLKKQSVIRTLFCKNQAKNMFKVAFLLFIFSIIFPFSKHYLYIGFATFSLAILLAIFGKTQQSNNQSKLLEAINIK